uniref:Phospholipase B-like n=1 Tax=Oncorhynchus mykiss TaxID=8022 RepID=A0A8C7W5M9_ONCMY
MKRLSLLFSFYVAATFASAESKKLKAATVYWDATHKTVQLKEGVIEKEGDAYGYLNDSLSYRNRYCENTLYTGFLVSLDYFYLLGSGLMMAQTTNNVFNTSLFSQVMPHSLLAWQRVRLFPMHFFTHFFTLPLSLCTYNNQYMIVDMRKVTLGHSIEDGALTVVEQIPGLVEFSDQTRALRRGYWSSYNVPFHPKIYTLSGYGKMCEEYGEDFSYDLCPRAKIFPQTHHEIQRGAYVPYYKNDPYSKGRSICCRNDLREKDPSPGGSEAVNGPTTTAHQGLPDHYDFPFISMQPVLFMP